MDAIVSPAIAPTTSRASKAQRRFLQRLTTPEIQAQGCREQRAWGSIAALGAISTFRRSRRFLPRCCRQCSKQTKSDNSWKCVQYWTWRGQRVAYRAEGPESGQAVVLIHGFGVSGATYRQTLPALADAGFRAYAVDLIGFGFSTKSANVDYSTELWQELIADFCDAMSPQNSVFLVGNSLGSLVSLAAAASFWGRELKRVSGLVLLNCGAGMNSKFLLTSKLVPLGFKLGAFPLFAILDAVLTFRPLAELGFAKLANKETVLKALESVYVNPDAVDDELLDTVLEPAADECALDVFVKVLTGDPGKSPDDFIPSVKCPIRLIWGTEDSVTPLKGDAAIYGSYFRGLAEDETHISLIEVHAGHVPQDDAPGAVHEAMLPWLANPPPAAVQRNLEEEDELHADDLVM